MIIHGKAYNDDEIVSKLNRLVVRWFKGKFKTFTPPQRYSIVPALEGKNVLVTSPTGSGKTLAGFLPVISDLVSLAEKGKLEDRIYAVYVSPLRALNNDIRRNLEEPLREIYEIAKEEGVDLQEIRVAVRTGDTKPDERIKQLKKPPHILITTPETLAIVLSTPKFSKYLKGVRYLIIDEIHALAENKRGTHLTLSMERLQEIQEGDMVRIGLSATIHPLDEVARFLVGFEDGKERDCIVADVTFEKKMDIKVLSPIEDFFGATAEEISEKLYKTIAEMIKNCRTALIFTNTRSATERVVYHLKKLLPDYPIKAHHSSLSREVRLEVEEDLKKGLLSAVVCVDPDSKVVTEEGVKSIKDMRHNKFVLGVEDGKVKFVRFRDLQEIDYNSTGLCIRTALGFEIKVTREHKLLTIDESLKWIEAKKLREGDYVGILGKIVYPEKELSLIEILPNSAYVKLTSNFLDKLKKNVIRKFGSINAFARKMGINQSHLIRQLNGLYPFRWDKLRVILDEIDMEMTQDDITEVRSDKKRNILGVKTFTPFIARLLGFWLADGSRKSGALTMFSSDLDMLKKYGEGIRKELGVKPRYRKKNEGTYRLEIYSKVIADMFKGLTAWDKKSKEGVFPSMLFTLPIEHKRQFLSGYFDCDGYLEVKNGIIYSAGFMTTNYEFAEGIRDLLLSFSIIASIRKRDYDEIQNFRGRIFKKKGNFYTVAISGGEYLKKFFEVIDPWRNELSRVKEFKFSSYFNKDVIPKLGKILRDVRLKLGTSTYKLQKELYNPEKVELGKRKISRRNLVKLLDYYIKQAKKLNDRKLVEELTYLSSLARGDILFDKIVEIKPVEIKKAYGIIDSESENYVVNGFISKNSSTSLELGIDIGYIDLVILIGSPKSINRALQRIGRSGHKLHETSVGRIVVVDQDDLVECTVLVKEALAKRLDRIHIPKKPLDVLCQHIVGMALERKWKVDEALRVIRRAYPYKDLTREELIEVLRYLSGKYSELEKERVYGKIWFDEGSMEFGKRTRLLRPIYYLNVGTIPDEVAITVVTKDGRFIGKVEEEFAERLVEGDVFVLAGKTFRFLYSRGMSIVVEEVEGVKPTIPSWFSEQLPLSYDLALRIQRFRRLMNEMIENRGIEEIIDFLCKEFNLSYSSAKAIYNYFYEQNEFSKIPKDEKILIEIFNDGRYFCYVFHTLVGRRANDAISRVFAYRIARAKGCDVKICLTDNGFMLKLPFRLKKDEIMDLFDLKNFREDLISSLEKTELLKRRFRHVAVRSLMILRNYLGKEKSVYKQQISADNILKLIKKRYPNFPILKETYREIVEDYMDVENAMRYLSRIGKNVEIVETPMVSPFALNMYLVGEEDVVLMADRREILRKLHEMIVERISKRF